MVVVKVVIFSLSLGLVMIVKKSNNVMYIIGISEKV